MKTEEYLSIIDNKLDMIVRGVYGDEQNKVKGLLQRQEEDEERWKQIDPLLQEMEGVVKEKGKDKKKWESVKPLLIDIDTHRKVAKAYRVITNKKMWGVVVTLVSSAITWVVVNWSDILEMLREMVQ